MAKALTTKIRLETLPGPKTEIVLSGAQGALPGHSRLYEVVSRPGLWIALAQVFSESTKKKTWTQKSLKLMESTKSKLPALTRMTKTNKVPTWA